MASTIKEGSSLFLEGIKKPFSQDKTPRDVDSSDSANWV